VAPPVRIFCLASITCISRFDQATCSMRSG
jgi:hypothetical protein